MADVATNHLRNLLVPHHGNGFRPFALRRRSLAAYGVAAVLVKLIIAVVVTSVPLSRVLPSSITPSKLVELTNKARTQNGLKPLRVSVVLGTAADGKARDMLAKGYFAHISPTNVTPWYWFKRAGYSYSYAGENLAIDYTTAEGLMSAWLASPSHRKNILNSNYRDIGIAVQTGAFRGSPTTVAVQFFGTPVAAPTVVKVAPTRPTVPVKPAAVVVNPPPKTQVLGETRVLIPPPPPSFLTPGPNETVVGPGVWVTGEAVAASTVTIRSGGTTLASGVTSSLGYFRLQLAAVPDGSLTITATTTDPATGLTSSESSALTVTVDGTPPTIAAEKSLVIPAQTYGHYDVFAGVSPDATEITARLGDRRFALTPVGDVAVGQVDARGATATDLTLVVRDGVGNETTAQLADLATLSPNLLIAPSGVDFLTRVKLLLFSRGVVLALVLFLVLALSIHLLSQVRVNHHPTTVSTLLLISFLGLLFFI